MVGVDRPCLVSIAICAWTAPVSAACNLRLWAQLPVAMVGSEALIVAEIGGSNAPVFLDTGAKFNLLSYDTAANLHLERHAVRGGLPLPGVGGAGEGLLAFADADVQLGAARIKHAEFILASLPRGPAAGLIGFGILSRYDIDYDLPDRVIKLFQSSGCAHVPLAYWARSESYSVAPFESEGASPTVNGYVNGIKMRVSFDTGASTSMLDTASASRAGVTPETAGAARGGIVYGLGGRSVTTWLVPVQSVRIGEEEIRNSQLRLGKLSLPDIDMVLGTDFFLSHHVYLAVGQRKVYFTYDGGPVFDSKTLPRNGK
jgi:hypothetical protein